MEAVLYPALQAYLGLQMLYTVQCFIFILFLFNFRNYTSVYFLTQPFHLSSERSDRLCATFASNSIIYRRIT